MADEAAVLDSPEIQESAPVETESTPVDTSTDAPADGADESTESEAPATEDGQPATGEQKLIDGNRLSDAFKARLEQIKAEDPKLAAQLNSAVRSADAWSRAFPGGLKEAAQFKQTVEQVGGAEGIQQLQSVQREFAELDELYDAGDPKFVEKISEASPEAFAKVAPAVFEKYLQVHPEGWTNYVSKVFVADMQTQGIPLQLERLQDFIADNPKAMAVWGKLAEYVNRINGFATKAVTGGPKNPGAPTPDAKVQELTERENTLTRTEWSTAANQNRMGVFNAEFTRLTNGRKISEDQTATIKELYVSRLQAAIKRTPDFNKNCDRYFVNKDKAGYLKYIGSLYKAEIPKALAAAVNAILPGKPGPAKPAASPAAPKPGQPAQVQRGAKLVAARPKEIDVTRTTPTMISQGKAVLPDGTLVQWNR